MLIPPCKSSSILGQMLTLLALLFEVLSIAENTGNPHPIRTPHTRRSFRGRQSRASRRITAVLYTFDRQLPAVLNAMRRRGIYHLSHVMENSLGQVVPKLKNEKRRPVSCWAAQQAAQHLCCGFLVLEVSVIHT